MSSVETFVTSPHEAVRIWFGRAQQEGAAARGVIFGLDVKSLEGYREGVRRILPAYRYAGDVSPGSIASYLVPSGATLDLCVVSSLDEAYAHGGRQWPIMTFHDPASWPDPSLLHYLTSLWRSHDGTPTQRIAVGTAFPSSPFDRREKVSRDIDYAAITRSVL